MMRGATWLLFAAFACAANAASVQDIHFIAFTKDRAAQFDLLLQSIAEVDGEAPVAITAVALASTPGFAGAYRRVQRLWRDSPHIHLEILWQQAPAADSGDEFADLLDLALASRPFTAFLTDDGVVTRPGVLAGIGPALDAFRRDRGLLTISLRLHPGVTHAYGRAADGTSRVVTPPPPLGRASDGPLLTWDWATACAAEKVMAGSDWVYPMSLDAHIFHTWAIRGVLAAVAAELGAPGFSSPNTLEDRLASVARTCALTAAATAAGGGGSARAAACALLPGRAACLPTAAYVSNHRNQVQTDFPRNRHGAGEGVGAAAGNCTNAPSGALVAHPSGGLAPGAPKRKLRTSSITILSID